MPAALEFVLMCHYPLFSLFSAVGLAQSFTDFMFLESWFFYATLIMSIL